MNDLQQKQTDIVNLLRDADFDLAGWGAIGLSIVVVAYNKPVALKICAFLRRKGLTAELMTLARAAELEAKELEAKELEAKELPPVGRDVSVVMGTGKIRNSGTSKNKTKEQLTDIVRAAGYKTVHWWRKRNPAVYRRAAELGCVEEIMAELGLGDYLPLVAKPVKVWGGK